jgi:hypothetical protein
MVLRTATKDENVPSPRTSVAVGARIKCRPALAHIAAREYSRMLLTHNDGCPAGQVDKPRFVGPALKCAVRNRLTKETTRHPDGR